MENKERKIINKRDTIIIILIIIFALASLIIPKLADSGGYAVVKYGNEVVARLDLDKSGDYTFPEFEGMVFTVADGTISVTESNCGDHTCMRTGAISRSGEVIVCVPNKAAVTIESKEQSDLDVVLK
ncbi:MAG: NusG domain II-containing protein, partial [Oscillospiraceae bacterium]|nr:NusG domain II-containing protein [Oscillospiraceae bacterium]